MITDNLKALRKEKGLSQDELGAILNVSQRCYASWEQGRTEPNIDMLIKLANIFECSVDYLLGRANDIGLVQVSDGGLTDIEKNLLAMFRKLDRQGQVKLYAIVQAYTTD